MARSNISENNPAKRADDVPTWREDDGVIVAIDDDPMTLRLLQGLLKHTGYRIQISSDAASGLKMINNSTSVVLVDLRPNGINGLEAQEALDKAAITVNKNAIPFDTEPISRTGGIRLGTPAMTTRGLREEEMMQVADFIHTGLLARHDEAALSSLRKQVTTFTARFPLP